VTFLAAALLGAAAMDATQSSKAVPYSPPFKWAVNSPLNAQVSTAYAGQWATAVQGGAWDWYYRTDLEVIPTSAQITEIYAHDAFSIDYPPGWATAYSNNYTCLTYPNYFSGNCNMTTEAATTGVIDLNDFYFDSDASYNQMVAAHELGHVFGLNHGACANTRIMEPPCYPTPHPLTTTAQDISDVATVY
jgi:hypothetical protein